MYLSMAAYHQSYEDMSDDRQIEYLLIIAVRRALVTLERCQEYVRHRSTEREMSGAEKVLFNALHNYEVMMLERNDDE